MKSFEQHNKETGKQIRKSLMIAGFSSALVLIVFAIIISSTWTETRKVKKIIIRCQNESIKQSIIHKIENAVLDKFKADINLRNIEKEAEKNSFVKSATAGFSSPETIEVILDERNPAVILLDRNNSRKISDINGEIIPFGDGINLGELPVMKCYALDNATTRRYIKSVNSIMQAFEKYGIPRSLIRMFDCSQASGDFTIITNNRNSRLLLNINDDIEAQCMKLALLTKSGSYFKFIVPGTFIDLRWHDRVVTGSI